MPGRRRKETLPALVDALVPGPDSPVEHASLRLQHNLQQAAGTPAGRVVAYLLRGNEWLGHPAHPVLVMVPIGAWTVTGWYDARAAATGDPRHDHVADGALLVGLAGAVPAAVTGVAQFLDTRDGVRRETAVHAFLNNVALTLYGTSWMLRRGGRRSAARRLSAVALALVGVSGYLGDDIAYRHGVGVRPQALRDGDVRHV